MQTIWKGAISFGLVHIPIRLQTATAEYTPRFRMLHAKDNSPVKTQRVCEREGTVIAWNDVVKGYEYEPGKFVVLGEEEFKAVEVKLTRTIDIMDFVEQDEIDPSYYDQPYHLVPQPGGEKAYALLRRAIQKTKRVGLARVVLRNREHLGIVRALGNALVLNLIRYPAELESVESLPVPGDEGLKEKEIQMAIQLVEQLSGEFEPEQYKDEYTEKLLETIRDKIEGKEIVVPEVEEVAEPEVIDLVARLKESLAKVEHDRKVGERERRKPARRSKSA